MEKNYLKLTSKLDEKIQFRTQKIILLCDNTFEICIVCIVLCIAKLCIRRGKINRLTSHRVKRSEKTSDA